MFGEDWEENNSEKTGLQEKVQFAAAIDCRLYFWWISSPRWIIHSVRTYIHSLLSSPLACMRHEVWVSLGLTFWSVTEHLLVWPQRLCGTRLWSLWGANPPGSCNTADDTQCQLTERGGKRNIRRQGRFKHSLVNVLHGNSMGGVAALNGVRGGLRRNSCLFLNWWKDSERCIRYDTTTSREASGFLRLAWVFFLISSWSCLK